MSRRPALRHRSSRRVPATLASLILIALAVGAVWAGVERIAQGAWPTWLSSSAESVSGATWQTPLIIGIIIGVGLVGLICLWAALKPGLPNAWQVTADHGERSTELVMSRNAVARLAMARADHVDGVDRVSARAGRRTVRLVVRMPPTEGSQAAAAAAALERQVTDTVQHALGEAGVQSARVRTSIRR